jgi:catechol 2,3-dioxygenase-like lactoylglutathione lyase family enzyme
MKIENVQVVSVLVAEQERAMKFYVGALGFEVRRDEAFGPGMRWVEVAPEGGATSLTLVTWFEDSMPPARSRAS